jgi:hypothetical protein
MMWKAGDWGTSSVNVPFFVFSDPGLRLSKDYSTIPFNVWLSNLQHIVVTVLEISKLYYSQETL